MKWQVLISIYLYSYSQRNVLTEKKMILVSKFQVNTAFWGQFQEGQQY